MTSGRSLSSHAVALEALLFLFGEPMPLAKLATHLSIPEGKTTAALDELADQLESEGRGIRVLRASTGIQLVTAPEHAELIERAIKAGMREQLMPAAAETLAIVAYRGPISRAGVEAIRGVNSSFTLRLLAMRGLVDRQVHPRDGRVYLYRVSADFLRSLGVTRMKDLPEYAAFQAHEGLTALQESAAALEGTLLTRESVQSSDGVAEENHA